MNDPAWMAAIDSDRKMEQCCLPLGYFIIFRQKQCGRWLLLCPVASPVEGLFLMPPAKLPKADAENLGETGRHSGCGCLFFSGTCKKELGRWAENLKVSSRGYMQGYEKLEGFGIKPVHRLLAKIADGPLYLQIVRMEFDAK